jgi:hypothetical protein
MWQTWMLLRGQSGTFFLYETNVKSKISLRTNDLIYYFFKIIFIIFLFGYIESLLITPRHRVSPH